MTDTLWTWDDLVAASGGAADGAPAGGVTGFSIDTRTLQPGEVFVALKDARDGHDFVPQAFAQGAAAALVAHGYARQTGDGALLRVDAPLAGLGAIARAARRRSAARIVAVTGSVGKTGTKEMLRAVLGRLGRTHAPEKSFNNHWGVPLTLARMPTQAVYGVFEIGMNHAGEITPLTAMVRPHVAIVTTVEAVHLEHFESVAGIADAKGEIFTGLEPGGVAIINCDNPWGQRLAGHARSFGARILTFGRQAEAEIRLEDASTDPNGTAVTASHAGYCFHWRLGAPGAHIAQNSLAVLAALIALDIDRAEILRALGALATLTAPQGRGARSEIRVAGGTVLLIDESYNANPASMRAALAGLAMVPRENFPRRVAVLGDMLELGPEGPALHEALIDAVDAAGIDLVFAAGTSMKRLFDRLPAAAQGGWAARAADIEADLLAAVRAGDAVMVKGSLGSRMGPLVEALKRRD
ncbi:MAG: UDP-N-acetylmuramoylalanyl-D-glutamyl-2,6-diaminopimelate--D-alanyl-D-alanine ligase [Hyphomicrobiaceae bacterium]